MKTIFMNLETGSTASYQDWWYKTEEGDLVNAVDRGEVVAVHWSEVWDAWVESDEHKVGIVK
jgi:hypothetical protein